ncbi:DUF262 domain-containing protein [Phaeobacter italicus]|uniref:DUF262 domain-containing protein n=1 Tax=Phaeobacter italicus TaxID=481446 RepID=UPI001ADA9F77|nr:DUF262 domain-containing protein [Phaeobacter italicus]MBO9442741.1 DUF262 domain-containing protein [Phaeobacter italicus]
MPEAPAQDDAFEKLAEQEAELSSTDEVNELPPNDIIAFNELRSCFDLVRLYDTGKLDIQPDFQREVVWQPAAQTRFIDSLAKQLPIPSMCIALDFKNDKRYMVDGLQRMSSLIAFFKNESWRLTKLDDVNPELSGKKVSFIKGNSPEIVERIENITIPVTVLRCDLTNRAHQEYLFTIFHRLNAGGSRLNNQEIRNCIFQGSLNSLLLEISKSETFVNLFDIKENKKYRFSNEELLLRALAHSESYETYTGPLSKYLNDFMSENRNVDVGEFRKSLEFSVDFIYKKVLKGSHFERTSKAVIEALLVATIRNRETLENATDAQIGEKYTALRSDPIFGIEALSGGLAAPDKVISRLARAIEIFK